ncbi:hypothetical protein [Chitinophaga sp. sic0106]|uniref:hypothetical protein n=1 Tax=Chitinophaga sp. sic0106 TaxID=2854785 RepID=UPI001C480735|nr:hypothetical protein [Chitinophaga sp. sic0106]MBV7532774.1 hypothetical protein [Chitinophaga sp. sic0106]
MLKVRYILFTILLLSMQVCIGMRSYASQKHHQLTLFQKIDLAEAREEYFEDLFANMQLHTDLAEDVPESIQATKNRRRTKYYLTATSQQFSVANRITYIDTAGEQESIYISPVKTGRYLLGKPFRPAYYSFLFRFTPF